MYGDTDLIFCLLATVTMRLGFTRVQNEFKSQCKDTIFIIQGHTVGRLSMH